MASLICRFPYTVLPATTASRGTESSQTFSSVVVFTVTAIFLPRLSLHRCALLLLELERPELPHQVWLEQLSSFLNVLTLLILSEESKKKETEQISMVFKTDSILLLSYSIRGFSMNLETS
jgi:hypothetical protein